MNYNDKLKELREKKNNLILKRQSINDWLKFYKENKDFDYVEKYKTKKQINGITLDNCYKAIDDLCKTVEKYSSFDVDRIGRILSQLITIFEGEKFIYQSASYYPNVKYYNEDAVIDSRHVNIIVLNELAQPNWYEERYLNSLVKNGNAIILFKGEHPRSNKYNIKFYQADVDNIHRINQCIAFGKLAYVKDFIDYVINFKIENNIEDISFEQLNKLKDTFICMYLEQIKKWHEELDERKTYQFIQSLEHEQYVRNRQLQKVLRNNQQQNIDK